MILLCLFLVGGCSTVQTISSPPEAYYPYRPTTDKELISSWQGSLMKIKEWQTWYDIQVGSNYFYTNTQTNN